MTQGSSTRAPVFGPEPWREHPGGVWTHWDLWFSLVCAIDFEGDWTALSDAIVEASPRFASTRDWEAKLGHLTDLERRLAAAATDARALGRGLSGDRALRDKARRKVLRQALSGRDLTPAMRETPRSRLRARALRGRFDRFPVSPSADEKRLAALVARKRRRGRGALGLSVDLEKEMAREDAARSSDDPARLALWRALIPVGLDALEAVRDRGGALASFLGDSLETYVTLPWDHLGLDPEDRYADLVELSVWEHWGLRYQREAATFQGLRRDQAGMVERIALAVSQECRAHRLDYEADEALVLVAYAHVAAGTLERFPSAAQRLGSDHWMPIVAMASAAIDARRVDVVRAVFAAANRPGWHRDLLAQRCHEMTGAPPDGMATRRPVD